MKKPKRFQTDTEQPTRMIRKKIFKVDLLKQDEIIPLFEKLDSILNKHVLLLAEHVPQTREYFIEIVERIASGSTLGKNYYDKQDHEDGKAKAKKTTILQPSEVRILKKSFNLLREDLCPKHFAKLIKEISFLRGVLEEAMELFLRTVQDYPELVKSLEEAKRLHSMEYARYETELNRIHEQLGISDTERILSLIKKVECGWDEYVEVRSEIINPYLRKVFKMATNFSSNPTQTLDNFQAGVEGLVRAISNYTQVRFAHFSVVAGSWIKQSILHYLKTEVNFIRLPMANWHYIKKIENAVTRLEHRLNREPTVEEISKETDIPAQKVKKIIENSLLVKVYSLDAPTTTESDQDSEGKWNKESVQDADTPESIVFRESEIEIIRSVIDFFDDEEKIIFGLVSGCYEVIPDPTFTEAELIQEKIRQRAAQYSLEVNFKEYGTQ